MNKMILPKFYLYAKDLTEPKYEFLIEKCKNAGTKHFNDSNALIECWNNMDVVYGDIDNYSPNRKRKISIVFDDMITDIKPNKKFRVIINELFIRCRKINISLVFIIHSYFSASKDVSLNWSHFLIMKINNKENYKILQLIILQTLITKIFWKFTENA